jgi:hypothetical protein
MTKQNQATFVAYIILVGGIAGLLALDTSKSPFPQLDNTLQTSEPPSEKTPNLWTTTEDPGWISLETGSALGTLGTITFNTSPTCDPDALNLGPHQCKGWKSPTTLSTPMRIGALTADDVAACDYGDPQGVDCWGEPTTGENGWSIHCAVICPRAK